MTRHERALGVALPLLLAVAWEAASAAGLLRVQFFPPPSTLLRHAWTSWPTARCCAMPR